MINSLPNFTSFLPVHPSDEKTIHCLIILLILVELKILVKQENPEVINFKKKQFNTFLIQNLEDFF